MGHLVHRSRIRNTETALENDDEERSKLWRRPTLAHTVPPFKDRGAALLVMAGMMLLVLYIYFHRNQQTHISQHIFPVMVQSFYLQHALSLELTSQPPKLIQDRRNHYWLDHGTVAWRIPPREAEGCTVLNEHHKDHNLNCNDFHNIDMTDFWLFEDRHVTVLENQTRQSRFRHIGEGGFRNAFYISEYNGTRRVLKTPVWRDDRPFDISNLERNRKDSVIASLLTSSQLNADIYGYCAQSALVDYSDDYDLYYLFDYEDPSKDELFDLAVDVVQSVADAHLPNSEGIPTVVHMDLKPDQWIKLNGKYILNDYNLAKFIDWNKEKGEYCNKATGYDDGRWQAPEQFTGDYPRTEKADIFSLGYVLNFLLTKEKPFPDLSGEETMKHVMKGGIWKVPSKYVNSTHPFDVAVRKAVEKCLKFDPQDRPSAQYLADFLRQNRKQ